MSLDAGPSCLPFENRKLGVRCSSGRTRASRIKVQSQQRGGGDVMQYRWALEGWGGRGRMAKALSCAKILGLDPAALRADTPPADNLTRLGAQPSTRRQKKPGLPVCRAGIWGSETALFFPGVVACGILTSGEVFLVPCRAEDRSLVKSQSVELSAEDAREPVSSKPRSAG